MRWTNGVNVSVSGGTLQKAGGCSGCADAGASSEQRIASGDGGMQFTAGDASTLRFIGLTAGAASHNPSEIQFALRIQGGVAEVRESGAYRSDVRIAAGDILGIYVVGGAIHYAKNGNVFHSSGTPVRYPLAIDTSLYDANSVIHDAMFIAASTASQPAPPSSSAPAPAPGASTVQFVRWTNAVNVSVADNNVRKTGGCSGCGDASATAEQTITHDGGAVQFTVDDPNGLKLVGLSSGGSGSAAEIEFGLRVQGGVAEVREAGSYKTETRIGSGDVLTIAISGGTVSYLKNGEVFFSSAQPPVYPMAAGVLLFDMNSSVANALIRTGS